MIPLISPQGPTPPPKATVGDRPTDTTDGDAFADVFAEGAEQSDDGAVTSDTSADDSQTQPDAAPEVEALATDSIETPETVPLVAGENAKADGAKFSTDPPKEQGKGQASVTPASTVVGEKPKTEQSAQSDGKGLQPTMPSSEKPEMSRKTVSQNIVENRLSASDPRTDAALPKKVAATKLKTDPETIKQPTVTLPTAPDVPKTAGVQKNIVLVPAVPPEAEQKIVSEPETGQAKAKGKTEGQGVVLPSSMTIHSSAATANPWNMTQVQQIPVQQNPLVNAMNEKAETVQDSLPVGATSERSGVAALTPTAAPATAGPETARHIASQIAVAIKAEPGRTTEIALNPPELGRVKLSMKAVDGVITLNVAAERQETIDLMRRHIDTLAQEFKSLGYDDISFSFAQREETDAEEPARNDTDPPKNDEQLAAETNQVSQPTLATSGLDLRL